MVRPLLWLYILAQLGCGYALVTNVASKLSSAPPVVLLPGFGNDARDYSNPVKGGEVCAFSRALERRGLLTYIVPVERAEWLNVARSVFTKDFWTCTCRPDGPAYDWYLKKVKDTVTLCREETGSDKVLLVAHSAGGWLARAALGNGIWEDGLASEDVISGLVTLGTPHFVGPMDMTRGALKFTNSEFPGAFLKEKGISYVTVAGTAVRGQKDAPRNSRARFAYGSYETVCGEGDTVGDACVPLVFAHLPGAEQITLDGVYHSIDRPDDWYGSEDVIDDWLVPTLRDLNNVSKRGQRSPIPAGLTQLLSSFWR